MPNEFAEIRSARQELELLVSGYSAIECIKIDGEHCLIVIHDRRTPPADQPKEVRGFKVQYRAEDHEQDWQEKKCLIAANGLGRYAADELHGCSEVLLGSLG